MKLKITLYLITFLVLQVVNAQPTISSFAPIAAKPGDAVAITGTNFNTTAGNNIVFFGATKATVTAATATNLTVTVPVGATYAPVTVLNTATNLAASSPGNFNPIYSPAKTSITSADFATKIDFATGTSPYSVAAGDIDGDGKTDVVNTNQSANTISVLRNTSTISAISFATKVDFATETTPISVALGDINGDGKLDILVANTSSTSISVFLNTSSSGNISFAAKVDFTVGTNPRSISIADLDGDGKFDIAVANSVSNNISVLRNTSTSSTISFATKVDFATGSSPVSISNSDIDGDGKPDLISANQLSDNVSVLRNTSTSGTVNFATKVDFASGTGSISVATGDMNADNIPDLVVANLNSNNISVFRNTSISGTISFATRINFTTGTNPVSVSIGDLDGDTKPDITVANNATNVNTVSVLRNTTSSTISFATKVDFGTGSKPIAVKTADINGDSRLDIITANNGSGANSISILRNVFVASTNADLNSLNISAGTLTPVFNSATTVYNVSVPNTITSFSVTPTVSEANATLQVNFNNGSFTALASGSSSSSYTLNVGSNSINVKVTAQDGTTIKTYTIFITRATSNDANLSALTISTGTLSPSFVSSTIAYTTTVLSSTTVITVTPTTNESNATIKVNVNGGSYFSAANGSPSGGLVLNVGNNTINIVVTAQDGTTIKTYTITVNRPTNVADLSSLIISSGTLSPSFIGGIIDYTTNVANTVTSVTVRPIVAVANATVQVNVNGGTYTSVANNTNSLALPLNTGANTISIKVTAADGITIKIYSILVVRDLSNNANLSNLTLSVGFLSPSFSSNTITYTALLQNNTSSITITPTRSEANATIELRANGGAYTSIISGTASSAIAISLGSNIIEVKVTAQDGTTIKTYTVNAIRPSNDANLSGLSINVGTLSPSFSSSTTEYTLTAIVSNSIQFATIIPTASDANATITARSWTGILGGGEPAGTASMIVISGNASANLLLFAGSTVIEIRVTAQDGTTSKVYNIRVVRAASNNANLSALSLTAGTLSPTFSTNTTAYTASVSNATTSVRVNFTRVDYTSIVQVKEPGGSFTSFSVTGGGSQQSQILPLNIGSNTIEVFVIAQNGTDTKLYTINVVRAGTSNPDLSSLTISAGTLSPVFSSGTIIYTASVLNSVPSITVTPVKSDVNTTIQVRANGSSYETVASGGTSSSLPLIVGLNIIEVWVTTAGSTPAKTYTLRITRDGYGPNITSITPASAKPGDVVTINGINFRDAVANDNIVFFGATKATVTTATATSLTVTVPTGAKHAPLTVLNTSPNLAGSSLKSFNPIYSPAKTNITNADFASRQNYSTGWRPESVAMGDIDGDGKPEMVVTANYGEKTVSVFRNTSTTGSTSFAARVNFETGETPTHVSLSDVDGDGKLDVIVCNYAVSTVSVLRNTSTNGTISFATKLDFTVGIYPSSVAFSDIDGDGKPDLVATTFTQTVTVLRNTSILGSISFTNAVNFSIGGNAGSIAIADLDGDGKLDLVTANFNSASFSILRNTSSIGSINFATSFSIINYVTGTRPSEIIVSDIDGDDKLDIVAGYEDFTAITVFRNNSIIGNLQFDRRVDFPTLALSYSLSVGDIDGDGKPDLAVTGLNSNNVSVLRNTSTSGIVSFAAKVDFATGPKPTSVAICDLDGDSKPDMAVTHRDDNTVSVFRNTDIALPIVLISFTAKKENNEALLQWTSKSEINAKEYEVENSFNGSNFNKIGTILAKGMASEYRFTNDHLPTNANTIYYRLKLVDKDGRFSYSEIRKVDFSTKKTEILVYPNPVENGILNIDLGEAITKHERYFISTIDGRIVHNGIIINRQQSININFHLKGSYLLKINNRPPIKILVN